LLAGTGERSKHETTLTFEDKRIVWAAGLREQINHGVGALRRYKPMNIKHVGTQMPFGSRVITIQYGRTKLTYEGWD